MRLIRSILKGGVYPPDGTRAARNHPTWNAMIPARCVVPLLQHAGSPARRHVDVGQHVEEGTVIGASHGYESARVHAPIPGVVTEITRLTLADGRESKAVVIELDGEFQQLGKSIQPRAWRGWKNSRIREEIFHAGVVGLGGEGIPSHVKYSPPENGLVEWLIINGCESEPYLSNDYSLLRERPQQIVEAVEILSRLFSPRRAVIALTTHTRAASSGLRKAITAADARVQLQHLDDKYPQGDEHTLVRAVSGRAVRGAASVTQAGCMVVNVGTAVAVYEAVVLGKPLVERTLTVGGNAIARPANLKVRIGASIGNLIEECGGFKHAPRKIVIGGPMRGHAVADLSQPVTKLTTGVLALTEDELYTVPETACVHCGRCVRACPMGLEPVLLHLMIGQGDHRAVKEAGIFDCTECGCCGFICPSGIPLVDQLKQAKSWVRHEESDDGE